MVWRCMSHRHPQLASLPHPHPHVWSEEVADVWNDVHYFCSAIMSKGHWMLTEYTLCSLLSLSTLASSSLLSLYSPAVCFPVVSLITFVIRCERVHIYLVSLPPSVRPHCSFSIPASFFHLNTLALAVTWSIYLLLNHLSLLHSAIISSVWCNYISYDFM